MLGPALSLSAASAAMPFWRKSIFRAESAEDAQAGFPAAVLDFSKQRYALPTIEAAAVLAATSSELRTLRREDFSTAVSFARGSVATYIDPITGLIRSAAANVPRFEADGLLLEGTVTTLNGYGTKPSSWGATNSTNTADATSFGDLTNAALVASTGSTSGRATVTATVTIASGVVLSGHVIVKAGTSGFAAMNIRNATANLEAYVNLNLTTGATAVARNDLGTISNITARSLGSGFWLLGFSVNLGTAFAAGTLSFGAGPYSATAGANVIVLGGQVCVSDRISSLVPNLTSSVVTRVADSAMLSDRIAALLRRERASVLVQGAGQYGALGRIIGGHGSARIISLNADQTTLVLEDNFGIGTIPSVPMADFGAAISFDASGRGGSYNGSTGASDTTLMSADRSEVYLGRDSNGNFANGHIKRLVVWPFRMTDAERKTKATPYS